MSARIIDGKAIAEAAQAGLLERVAQLRTRGVQPCLVAVTATADGAWSVYQRNQAKACAQVGILYRAVELPADATQDDLSEIIEGLNVDPTVHGIIVQSPLREPFVELTVQALLSPDKDVEAVGPANQGLVFSGRHSVAPCTAVAAVQLAQEALGDLRGIEAVVVGAGIVVGRPIAQLLLAAGATVTTCHVDTRDLAAHTRRAELLIVAVGRPGLIGVDLVRPGATVIDVGINRISGPDGKAHVVGDVDPAVADVAGALTPVPGGVGAITTTVLLAATIACAERLAVERPVLGGEILGRLLGGASLPAGVADRVAELLARHLIHIPGAGSVQSALERRLARGVVIFDGAMGSELLARGIPPAAVARANLDHPDLVREVHRAYVQAGAEAVTANTFGANRYRCPDSDTAVRIASAGVRLAREVARSHPQQPFVLGSIGPLGPVVGADITVDEASDAAAEIALAIADAGADGIIIETCPSTTEAAAMLSGIRRVTRLPVIVSRSLDRDDPGEIAEFAQAMEQGGAAAIGVNCAAGPRALVPVVARLAASTRLPVIARPNAGFPQRVGSRTTYQLRPDYLIQQAQAYIAAGANGVGGCCGVGPDHIRALAQACAGAALSPRSTLTATVAASTPVLPPAPHPLLESAAAGRFPVLAFAPGRLAPGIAAEALSRLADAGAAAVGLLTGWPGSARGARLPARLRHVQDACAKPAVLELLSGGTTLAQAQEILLAAHWVGVRLVLIDGGVFPADTRAESILGAADAPALLALCRRLNLGRDLANSRIEEPTRFTIGVRIGAADIDSAEGFAAQGADFLTLQPVYQPARFRDLMQRLQVTIPVFAEVLLLPDAAVADELDNELPALSVPERLKQRLRSDPHEDVAGVLRFLAHWRNRLAGVCLLLPDERTAAAEQVLGAIGDCPSPEVRKSGSPEIS